MKISLVTACYNSEATIQRTLESVAAQKGRGDIEHVIQDGGSNDGTLGLIEDYRLRIENRSTSSTPKFSVSLRSEQDAGFYDAINKGIQRGTGDIVGLINADDWLADDHVLNDVPALFRSDDGLDIVYGDIDYVQLGEGDGGDLSVGRGRLQVGKGHAERLADSRLRAMPFPHKVKRHWVSGQHSLSAMRNGWMPPHPTIYVRRRVFEEFGVYRLDLGSAADYEWIVRIFAKAHLKAAYLPRVTVKMLVGGQSNESLSARLKANKMDRLAWKVNGLRPYPWFALAKPLRKFRQFI